jgi:hypothetical protein
MSGMPSRVRRAWAWKVSTMSAQASGVLGVCTEPPPDSTDPSRQRGVAADGAPLGLGHLPDLLLQRHLGQQQLGPGGRLAGGVHPRPVGRGGAGGRDGRGQGQG